MAIKLKIPGVILPEKQLAEFLIDCNFIIVDPKDDVDKLRFLGKAIKSELLIMVVEDKIDIPFVIKDKSDIPSIIASYPKRNYVYMISDKKIIC